MRDNDFMHSCVKRDRDPFIVSSKLPIDAWVMKRAIEAIPEERRSDSQWKGAIGFAESTGPDGEPIGGTRNVTAKKKSLAGFINRLTYAFIGGLFLVGPMWLMVLYNRHYTSLVTTTVCVFLFGLIMARALDEPIHVLNVTAAYAAVLVVFVGTNTNSQL